MNVGIILKLSRPQSCEGVLESGLKFRLATQQDFSLDRAQLILFLLFSVSRETQWLSSFRYM